LVLSVACVVALIGAWVAGAVGSSGPGDLAPDHGVASAPGAGEAVGPPAPAFDQAVVPVRPAPTGSTIVVHVSGAVATPGIVQLASDARVADAIAAGGGATPEAELAAINLAARVSDGAHIVVPSAGSVADDGSPAGGAPGSPDLRPPSLVPLNTADAAMLQQIPGVGPVLAARIVEHRDEHGPFEVIEDLLDVPGIGEGRLADLRARLRLP
jgi:competence protein ComEA